MAGTRSEQYRSRRRAINRSSSSQSNRSRFLLRIVIGWCAHGVTPELDGSGRGGDDRTFRSFSASVPNPEGLSLSISSSHYLSPPPLVIVLSVSIPLSLLLSLAIFVEPKIIIHLLFPLCVLTQTRGCVCCTIPHRSYFDRLTRRIFGADLNG